MVVQTDFSSIAHHNRIDASLVFWDFELSCGAFDVYDVVCDERFALIGEILSQIRAWWQHEFMLLLCILISKILFKSSFGVYVCIRHFSVKNITLLSPVLLCLRFFFLLIVLYFSFMQRSFRLLYFDEAILQSGSSQLNPDHHCQLVVVVRCLRRRSPFWTETNINTEFHLFEPREITLFGRKINHK